MHFWITDPTIKVHIESYKRFPFLADIKPATFGRFYEFRTYFLKPGGLAPTMASWQEAIAPAGEYTSHMGRPKGAPQQIARATMMVCAPEVYLRLW